MLSFKKQGRTVAEGQFRIGCSGRSLLTEPEPSGSERAASAKSPRWGIPGTLGEQQESQRAGAERAQWESGGEEDGEVAWG